jgi:hypothetical protein
LIKNVHQTPWLTSAWSRLSTHLVQSNHKKQDILTKSTLVISSNRTRIANEQSKAYEFAALAQQNLEVSRKLAQRAVMAAPWRLSAWQALK